MKSTFSLRSGGRLIVQPSATRRSVQLTYKPVAGPSLGLLVDNDLAGVICQAIEAVATLNEERGNPPELPPDALAPPLRPPITSAEVRAYAKRLSKAWEEGADAMEAAALDAVSSFTAPPRDSIGMPVTVRPATLADRVSSISMNDAVRRLTRFIR